LSTVQAQRQIELHRALAPRYALRYGLPYSGLFQRDWHEEMIAQAPHDARRVLDLGCGTGFFLADLETDHPGSVGIDISRDMLRVSEQYVPGARLVHGDAERLPFAEHSFDAIFCKGSLHHTRDHVGLLARCGALLSDGGALVLSEPCNDNPIIRLARRVLYRRSQHFDEGDEGFTRRGIVALCERAGLEVTTVRKYGVFAYVLAGFPDHLPVLRWVPGNVAITRLLIRLDRILCRVPGLSILGFHIVVVARRRSATGG
jgi:SAM-dependent methyltransferase